MNSGTFEMPFENAASALSQPRWGVRIVLISLALIETWLGFSDATALFGDTATASGSSLGGFVTKVHLAAHPVLAIAALVFASLGRIRPAIIALGIVILFGWLNDMPSVVLHGMEFKSTFSAVETTARIIAFPLIAACAIAYAARGEHLGRATLLVAAPTLFNMVLLVGFFVSVMIYGF